MGDCHPLTYNRRMIYPPMHIYAFHISQKNLIVLTAVFLFLGHGNVSKHFFFLDHLFPSPKDILN